MRAACTSFLALCLVGCATTAPGGGAGSSAAAPDAPSSAERAREAAQLQRKLEVADARLAVAKLEAEASEQKQQVELRQANAELELAQARLAAFRESGMPLRLANERLSLELAQDRAQEAADELEQIELMYADQDLDDLTAEFVVSRGRRSAERAARRIEIQTAELAALEGLELPQEEQVLSLAVDKATDALRALEAQAETARQKAAIAVKEAENAVVGIQEEQAELSKKAQP